MTGNYYGQQFHWLALQFGIKDKILFKIVNKEKIIELTYKQL
jgi:hypothetical protein